MIEPVSERIIREIVTQVYNRDSTKQATPLAKRPRFFAIAERASARCVFACA
jgi:hypothetical protein